MASLAAPAASPVVFDTKQRVLTGATATLVPLFVCMVSGILTTRARNPALRASPAMPRATDMGIATAFALALLALRPVAVDLFSPLARLALPEQFRTNDFRVKRFSTWIFKMTYYTVLAAVGYWLQKDEAWFPVSLGGSGDASLSFAIVDTPPSYALKLYVLMTFAFLLHNLLFVLFCKPFESDTMEYVVHDCTGMLLIGTSYFVNYTAPAAIIAFLNDLCDIFACASKMGTDSRRMGALAPTLVGFLFSWWYTRLFVFPTECLRALIVDAPRLDPHVSMLFLQPLQGMFTILLVLQAYWYWGMARKGFRVLFQVMKIQGNEPAVEKAS